MLENGNAPTRRATGSGAHGASVGDRPAQHSPSARQAIIGGSLAAPLLARLDRVIPAGPGHWYARCPAHEDRSPSLDIRETDKVLVICRTGCDSDDVLAAVGLKWADLYPDRWECAAKRPNEGARKYVKRTLAQLDPLDIEREILRIAAADRRAGRPESVEDRARVQVAIERVRAARGA